MFSNLPLNELERSYQLYPEKYAAEIHYQETAIDLAKEKIRQTLIYNSLAAFSLIENLEELHFRFPSGSFIVTRSKIQSIFGSDLNQLLTEKNWQEKVQKP